MQRAARARLTGNCVDSAPSWRGDTFALPSLSAGCRRVNFSPLLQQFSGLNSSARPPADGSQNVRVARVVESQRGPLQHRPGEARYVAVAFFPESIRLFCLLCRRARKQALFSGGRRSAKRLRAKSARQSCNWLAPSWLTFSALSLGSARPGSVRSAPAKKVRAEFANVSAHARARSHRFSIECGGQRSASGRPAASDWPLNLGWPSHFHWPRLAACAQR